MEVAICIVIGVVITYALRLSEYKSRIVRGREIGINSALNPNIMEIEWVKRFGGIVE